MKKTMLFVGAMLIAAATATLGQATEPLTLVVPTMPGGGIDTYARILAKGYHQLGQTAIVENRPGGGTDIGADYVVRSEPNGKTVLVTVNTIAIEVAVSKKMLFDPVKDLVPVAYLGSQSFVVGVGRDIPAKTLGDLVAILKKPNSNYSFASCGEFTAQHLAGELINWTIGSHMLHVPYKGCEPAAADVAGGHVQVAISPITTVLPFVQNGTIRPLAVTSTKRNNLLPQVPTAEEVGLKGYVADQWWGLFVAAKTPRNIVDKINADAAAIVNKPDVIKTLNVLGIEPTVSSADDFKALFHADIDRWSKLAKAIGLHAD